MHWEIGFHPEFEIEFGELPEAIQDELYARLRKLGEFGPGLRSPRCRQVGGIKLPNMKELRFQLDGIWRFAFAFDPNRQAIVLVGGDKEGEKSRRFYRRLIKVADARLAAHIAGLKKSG
jgi:hypothetical protein